VSRRVAVTGLAALIVAVIAIGSIWAIGRPTLTPPGQSPSPAVSVVPSPTGSDSPAPSAEIPSSAMLQAADVGVGYIASDSQVNDHGSIVMMMSYCGQGNYSTAAQHQLAFRLGSVGQSDQAYVVEEVSLYEATWAARHISDLRAALPRCQTVDVMANPNYRVNLTVVASNFVGDESLLIKETGYNGTQYHAVVRQGDFEARLRIHTGATESEARAIATNAAQRLCAVAPSC
jgi:hypothetical protein